MGVVVEACALATALREATTRQKQGTLTRIEILFINVFKGRKLISGTSFPFPR